VQPEGGSRIPRDVEAKVGSRRDRSGSECAGTISGVVVGTGIGLPTGALITIVA
jgi:hypothetical protein